MASGRKMVTISKTDDCGKNEQFDPQPMYEPGEMPHQSGSVAVFRDMATPDGGLGILPDVDIE
ncbi:MAG: hypothetical protein HZA46_09405 [Planctomycetales bacterium]|nr:hypothetical protein [Planctomycetales bacterium]